MGAGGVDRSGVESRRMLQEFREFIAKGNVVMLAVGFIMGVAFQGVVNSLVENVIMPIVAIPFGQPNFDSLALTVNDSVIAYGAFITAAVVFLLTALAVFLFIVKPYNAYVARRSKEEEVADPGPTELELLTEIRDSLRSRLA
jgi:large conductance mechanosensitive channel